MATRIPKGETIDNFFKKNAVSEVLLIEVVGYQTFYYNTAFGNCKHCYLNNLGYCLSYNEQDTLKRMDELFSTVGKLTFGVNLTNKKYIDKLKKHFLLIKCDEIETGYHGGIQYHAVFLTNYTRYSSYNTYKKRIIKKQKEGNGKKLSPKVIDKIISYKRKGFLKKYLNKLVIK